MTDLPRVAQAIFSSQHAHGGSQLSLTPVPGDLTPFPVSMGTRHIHGAHIYMQAKETHLKKIFRKGRETVREQEEPGNAVQKALCSTSLC